MPAFWSHDSVTARLLAPLSPLVAAWTARRLARDGWEAPIPVICCGNVTVGGTGKTPVVQDIVTRLNGAHVITRGYGGSSTRLHRVLPTDPFEQVGDEALLHAKIAPTWRCANRAEAARAAIEAGARVLVMDDGLQNPSLAKTASLLIIDGGSGFGNGRILPAGPLREPIHVAAGRCCAAVIVGEDVTGAWRRLPLNLPILHAQLVQDSTIQAMKGRRILPFAGIGRPEKFFRPLHAAGAIVVMARPFPDHYPYSPDDCRTLLAQAQAHEATLVTTPKDAVRLPKAFLAQVVVLAVRIAWQNPEALDNLLTKVIEIKASGMP